MIFFKKSLFSVVEIPLVIVLFVSAFVYYGTMNQPNDVNYKFNIDSMLDSMYYSENYRHLIMDENLSSLTIDGNWSNVSSVLSEAFLNYELIIFDSDNGKKIFSCSSKFDKFYGERVISIKDNDIYDFRKIRLGVCY
ncbi:MAG: hypothetical protein KC589_08810 [Nanoarchaeota archaeon]|nr:hypothetical protein [Nanoarchaeota archaeon]